MVSDGSGSCGCRSLFCHLLVKYLPIGSLSALPIVPATIAVINVITDIVNATGFTPMNVTVKYNNPIKRIKNKAKNDTHACTMQHFELHNFVQHFLHFPFFFQILALVP